MRRVSAILSVGLLALCLAAGCIRDDRTECVLSVSFRYDYNVKEADAFSQEVRSVTLYLFDGDGILLSVEQAEGGFPMDFSLDLPSLPGGEYTFVALGRNRPVAGGAGEFEFPQLTPGFSTVSDLTMRLDPPGGVSRQEFAALYSGYTVENLCCGRQRVEVPMMKLTNRFRILLMPYTGGELSAESFDIRITASTAWLDYRAEIFAETPLTFIPFRQETLRDEDPSPGTVSTLVLADLMVSRLLCQDHPRLEIRGEGDTLILSLDLAWFLSLQGIAEHRSAWSDQSYLDRQDFFNLTFFLDGNRFIKSHIIVNGWVLSLSDITLG